MILLLAALPATATVVTLERDGTPVAGEVCRFRAADAENPFRRWLASQEVTCAAAGTAMEFPEGQWNVFGRIEGAAVSDPVLVEKAPPSLTLALKPAATLTTSRSGIVYAPRRATAYPLTSRTTVPAGEELWLLVVEKSKPVALFAVPAVEAGTERNADASGAALTGVLAWLQVPEEHRAAMDKAHGVAAPQVRAGVRNADPLPPLPLLNGAFAFVRGVEAGDVDLDLGGRGWLPHRRRVNAGANSVTTVAEPLLARGAATVVVHWSSIGDVPALDDSIDSCNAAGDKPPQYEITLSRCAAGDAECTSIRKEVFARDVDFSSFAAEDLVPGRYRVEGRFGKLPPVSVEVGLAPFDLRDARVQLRYFELYGSLTRGGEPLGRNAALELPGGIGFAPAATGEYRAVLLRPLAPDASIEITTCDGELRAVALTDRPVRPNARYDIDIPANRLVIEVTDTFTREPLRGASVRYSVMRDRPPVPVLTRTMKTNEEGRITLDSVPVREIEATVSLSGYERQELEPFTMPKSGEKVVEVQLVPVRGSQARIRSSRPFDSATIYWFSPAGRMLERAEVAPDGTFTLATAHSADETMAVVSASHPLWVRRSPSIDLRGALELPFPDAPGRSFEVMFPRPGTHLGLVIGGVPVPWTVFHEHQALRNVSMPSPGLIRIPIRDIAETGRIEVHRGTNPDHDLRPVLPGIDLIVFQP